MAGIFLSYRRADSEDLTFALGQALVGHFGKERVFLDWYISYGQETHLRF
jgi:hypothetical protein